MFIAVAALGSQLFLRVELGLLCGAIASSAVMAALLLSLLRERDSLDTEPRIAEAAVIRPETGPMGARARIALVGAGAMGANHARVIAESDSADLAVIIDTDCERVRPLAERLGCAFSEDLDAAAGCDAAVIATPTAFHEGAARALLELGKPILVEKPVTPDLETSRALVACAERRGVPLMCGFVERYNPVVATMRGLLDEEPVHIVGLRHSPATPRSTLSVVFDLLIHEIDLALAYMGGARPSQGLRRDEHRRPRSDRGGRRLPPPVPGRRDRDALGEPRQPAQGALAAGRHRRPRSTTSTCSARTSPSTAIAPTSRASASARRPATAPRRWSTSRSSATPASRWHCSSAHFLDLDRRHAPTPAQERNSILPAHEIAAAIEECA